jgi:hypothetical protein
MNNPVTLAPESNSPVASPDPAADQALNVVDSDEESDLESSGVDSDSDYVG